MAKTREQKKDIVKNLQEKMTKAKSMVFVNFKGLNIKDTDNLRKACKKEQIEYYVAKKTLINLALKDKGYDKVDAKGLIGEIATVFSYQDEVAPFKLLSNFAKEHDNVKLVSGIFEGKEIAAEMIKSLAGLPSRQELLTRLVGCIKAPLSGLVAVLSGNLRQFVAVLNAIKDKKTT
jgi:large subunit ribosomal protein L10